jgi:hypothetical protein
MLNKRLVMSVILGLVAGLICYLGGKYGAGMVFSKRMLIGTLLNRTMIGFVIGISAWKMNKYLHGALIGLIVSALMAVFAPLKGAVMIMVAGMIYGIAIEWIVSDLLKAPRK